MKQRNGFVSNSSSSSFVVNKQYLSPYQIDKIINHGTSGEPYCDCTWDITDSELTLEGWTYLDNFDMQEYMEKLGVDMSKVEWKD